MRWLILGFGLLAASAAWATKPQAPAQISIWAEAGKAVVQVRFEAPSEQAAIRISGTNGMALSGELSWHGAVKAGGVKTFSLTHPAPPQGASVAVAVSMISSGQNLGLTRTHRVDSRAPKTLKGEPLTVQGHPARLRKLR